MNLMTGAELYGSGPAAPAEPVLDIEAGMDIAVATGQVHVRSADGLQECSGPLDGIGRAVKRVQMGGGSETFSEAYAAEGHLSNSILAELHEAIVTKRDSH